MRLDPDYVTADQIALGTGESEIVTERETPTDFQFVAGEEQSVRQRVAVRVSNPGTSSATEDVTLTLAKSFAASDTTVASETQSVTVAAGDVETPLFLATEAHLNPGTYHVTVSTSGTELTVEQVDVHTRDIQLAWELGTDGAGRLIDHGQRTRIRVSPFDSGVRFPEGIVGQQGTRIASFDGGGLSVSSGETPTLQTERVIDTGNVTVSGDGSTTTFTLPHDLGMIPDVANLTPTSAAAASNDPYKSGMTSSAVEVTFTTTPSSGTTLSFDVVVFGSR